MAGMSFPDSPPPALEAPAAPELQHSGMGVAAFIISVVAGPALFAVFIFAGLLHMRGAGEQSPAVMLVGLLVMALCGAHAVGIGLAIAALCQAGRRKVFSVLGLVFNGIMLLGTVGLMILGVAMKK